MTEKVGTRLRVAFTAEWRVEMDVDLVKYFNALTEAEQDDYRSTWQQDKDKGYTEWEFPVVWMGAQDDDGPMGGWLNHHDAIVREDVDLDNTTEYVQERIGYEGGRGTLGSSWTEQDYHDLCDHVPWLNTHRLILAGDDGMTAEDLARIPGPNDVSLFDA